MILDTNAISALAERDPDIISAISSLPKLTLNLISLGEYRFGIDGSFQKELLQQWLDMLMRQSVLVAPRLETLSHYSQIRHELKKAGTPIPANDLWIAALCREHGLPLLSKDKHFDEVQGLLRMEW